MLNKTTPTGKALRTFLQAIIGICAFSLGVITIPGVYEYLYAHNIVALPALATIVSLVTFIQNFAEKLLAERK